MGMGHHPAMGGRGMGPGGMGGRGPMHMQQVQHMRMMQQQQQQAQQQQMMMQRQQVGAPNTPLQPTLLRVLAASFARPLCLRPPCRAPPSPG
jgi:hypothetical protein